MATLRNCSPRFWRRSLSWKEGFIAPGVPAAPSTDLSVLSAVKSTFSTCSLQTEVITEIAFELGIRPPYRRVSQAQYSVQLETLLPRRPHDHDDSRQCSKTATSARGPGGQHRKSSLWELSHGVC